MCAYVYVRLCKHAPVHEHVCMRVYKSITYVYVHVYVSVYTFMCTPVCVLEHMHVRVYKSVCARAEYVRARLPLCVYVCVRMCVCSSV